MVFNYAKYSLIVVHCIGWRKCYLNSSLALWWHRSYALFHCKYVFFVVDYSKSRWHLTIVVNMNDSIGWFAQRNLTKLSSLRWKINFKSWRFTNAIKWQRSTSSKNTDSVVRCRNRSDYWRKILNSNHIMVSWWNFSSIWWQLKSVRWVQLSFINFHW